MVINVKLINNVLIVMLFVLSLFSKNYLVAFGVIPFLIVSFVIRRYNKNLEFVYLFFVFISYVLGFVFDYYDRLYFFDALAHSLFGLVGSVFALPLLNKFKKYEFIDVLFNVFFIIIFTVSLAGLWEIFEFTVDKLFVSANMQRSLNNTMKDIISALLFSFVYSFIYFWNPKLIEKIFIRRN